MKEPAIFDWPKGGLNGVEKFEPYDFLIIQLTPKFAISTPNSIWAKKSRKWRNEPH